MILKSSDDKTKDVATLEGLLRHPSFSTAGRRKVEQELRNMRSGEIGEREAAYEIDFHYGESKNWAVIHDLRLEQKGRVAQIDHILINRVLDVWVCESKRFTGGLAINEHGEFSSFFDGKPYGVPSPIEQNHKHCLVVQSVLNSGAVKLPSRLGFTIQPTVKSLVLISKNARIERPVAKVDGLDEIVKVDQFFTQVDKAFDRDHGILSARKIIGPGALEMFARNLAALHRPGSFDWQAKFGLTKTARAPTKDVSSLLSKSSLGPIIVGAICAGKPKLICVSCSKHLSAAVVQFCQSNKARFAGKILCMACQKKGNLD